MAEFLAVTFDMWETVVTDPHEVSVARDAQRAAGMAATAGIDPAKIIEALDALRRHLTRVQHAEGDLSTDLQLNYLLNMAGGPAFQRLGAAEQAALREAYISPLFDHPPLLVPGVAGVLAGLAEAGTPVGLICNTGFTPGSALRRLLGSMGVLDYFGAMFFSGDTGVSKPAPRAFNATLQQLAVSAASTVHVGDNPATDVAGAKRAGLHAALLARGEQPPPPGHGADVVVRSMPEFAVYLGLST